MWDLISNIDTQIESWKDKLWESSKVYYFELTLDTFLKVTKDRQTGPDLPQNKDIKSYKAFQALNDRVKKMCVFS